jgi:2-methylcitrate dehydratase PrpD
MMKKIKMEVSPELAKLGFIGTAPIRLKVYLKDGMAITLSNDLAVGNPEKPLSEQVVKEKFMDCSKGAADQEKAEKWYEILKNLENATQEEILSLGNP